MTRAGDADHYSNRVVPADPERLERERPAVAPAALSPPEPKISLTVIMNVLMIWKAWIIGIVLAFAVAGIIFLEFTSPTYRSSASVMLGNDTTSNIDLGTGTSIIEDLEADTPTIQGQIEVMTSRDLAERVIRDLDLVNDPEFSPNARIQEAIDAGESDAVLLGEEENLDELVRAVSGGLSVRQVGLTSVIEMQFSSGSARKSATIANAFAQAYIDSKLEAKTNAVDSIATGLRDRLATLRERVQEAELALASARANDVLVDGQSLETVNRQIEELSRRLIEARANRITAEATLNNIDRAAELGRSLEVLLELRNSPIVESLANQREDLKRAIAGLQPRLLDRHPEMIALRDELASVQAQIDVELQGQADRLRIQYQAALAEEQALMENIRELEAQKTTVDAALQRVAELEREATVEQRLYESALARFREIDEQRSFLQPDATIIEKASVPPWPAAPKKKLIVAFATALGIMTALGVVLIVEATRDTFTNPAALYVHTGVPVLGVLPKLKRLRIDQKMQARLAGSVSGRETLETARRIHLTLVPRDAGGGTRVIGITSALPGDGKTFCAMLLGQVSAGTQKKTLLIDADLRKPGLYPALNVKDFDGRGLTSLVPGIDNLLAHTWRHPELPLYVLPADAGGKRIAFDEYSQIKKLAQVIEEARNDFDVIIVRMPPVVPSSDALSIAPLVDDTLFVVAWNRTKRGSVWKGLTDLASIEAYPTGMILNAADMKRANQRDFYGQNFDYGAVQKYYS